MNEWLVAALALLVGLLPCGLVWLRGDPVSRLVGLEMAGTVDTLVLLLLAQAYHRPVYYHLGGGGPRAVLLLGAAATALVGGVMCVLQHHLTRMLAYATVSHVASPWPGSRCWCPRGWPAWSCTWSRTGWSRGRCSCPSGSCSTTCATSASWSCTDAAATCRGRRR
jgi:hypothetical protein